MRTIEKVAWARIKERKMLFVRPKGKDYFINAGGKIEPGETHEQALCREVREELSVGILPASIRAARAKPFVDRTPDGDELVSHPYFADALGPLIKANEVEEIRWLGSADGHLTTPMGRQYLAWAKELDLID